MEANSMNIRNTKLSYYDAGQGKPVVLIHGFAGSKLYWEKVIPVLSNDYRVIAIDLPGHGESGMGSETYSIEEMAGIIKDFLAELKLDKVTMFGHSMGGYIALAFADQYSQHLNGFSLVHSTAFPDGEEAKEAREANARKVQEEGLDAFMEGLAVKLFSPVNSNENAADIKKAAKIGKETSVEGVVSALLAMKNRPDRNEVLKKTNLPVMLIAGDQDQIIPSEKTFSISRDHIQQHLIKGAGHMSMYEQPEVLVTTMKNFLEKI